MNPFNSTEDKTRNQKEYKLQTYIVKKHEQYFPHVIMTHVPNRPSGETDSARARDAYFKKELGVRAGVCDLLLWWNWQKFAVVEIKVDSVKSSAQNKFMSAIRHIGGHEGVAHSWQEYYKLLCSFGITPTHTCTVFEEPDYRSENQKKHDAFDFYKA